MYGIIPAKCGNGIRGVNDRGFLISFFGNKLNGGGIRCLLTNTSWDYSDYWYDA
jgi:hypothetical protein